MTTATDEQRGAKERRNIRNRVNQMDRAIAAVTLAVDALSHKEKCIVLHECLSDALARWKETEAYAD